MINPVIQDPPFTPELGDILFGAEYIAGYADRKRLIRPAPSLTLTTGVSSLTQTEPRPNVLPVFTCGWYHPWSAIQIKFGIEPKDMERAFKYNCPFTSNKFYWCIPCYLILRGSVQRYRIGDWASKNFDYEFDVDFHSEPFEKQEDSDILRLAHDPLICSYLGHGFTDVNLPNDGDGDVERVLIELDNGDALLCLCWVWYNK